MNKSNSSNKLDFPSEEQIELLLKGIQPKPSLRFHQRMGNQLWKRAGRGSIWAGIQLRGLPAMLILGMILVLGMSLATPSLEVLANRIAQFFNISPDEQITIQIPVEDLTDPEARFDLSILEAEEMAGFQAKTPLNLPAGFSFKGAEHHPTRNAIVLNYISGTGDILRISQRPFGVEYQTISANADIEIVNIGDTTGEYVAGGWTTTTSGIPEETPNSEVTLQASWDPDAHIQILRWQDQETIFEIIFSGSQTDSESHLGKNELIRLAEDLH
jgi:hypothetical protein